MTFTLVGDKAAEIWIDKGGSDYKGLSHVAKILSSDIKMVTDKEPQIVSEINQEPQIVVATKGTSDLIAQWEKEEK